MRLGIPPCAGARKPSVYPQIAQIDKIKRMTQIEFVIAVA